MALTRAFLIASVLAFTASCNGETRYPQDPGEITADLVQLRMTLSTTDQRRQPIERQEANGRSLRCGPGSYLTNLRLDGEGRIVGAECRILLPQAQRQ